MRKWALSLLALLACCNLDNQKATLDVQPTTEPAAPEMAPKEKLLTATGLLEIAPIVYGKRQQPVTVYTEGNPHLLTMWYEKEHLRYANKRVVITGNWADFNPEGQSFRYFKTESITLAPGEVPHDNVPDGPPPPPLVRSMTEIAQLKGGWGVAFGKAKYHYDPKNSKVIEKVTVVLDDSFEITKYLWRHVTPSRYEQDGKATILFRRARDKSNRLSPMEFCLGHDRRCGMVEE